MSDDYEDEIQNEVELSNKDAENLIEESKDLLNTLYNTNTIKEKELYLKMI